MVGKLSAAVLLFLSLSFFSLSVSANLVVRNAERNIDISTQIVKEELKLTFENVGGDARDFTLVIEQHLEPKLAWLTASEVPDGGKKGSGEKKQLKVVKGDDSPKGRLYKVSFSKALGPKETRVVEVNSVYTHVLDPFPAKINQNQAQLVRYFGNAYPYLAYETSVAKTTLTLSSSNVESYTRVKPSSQQDTTVTYGPYDNLPAYSKEEVVVHYENNSPFLTVTSLNRWIEVSHWGGNIAIEEDVDVVHSGARLNGPFSRHEYQRGQGTQSSVASYRTLLPAAANSVYYRDDIGNISTSALRELEDAVEVELRPRFPLFGGWKTKYKIGYNVPSYEYLFTEGDKYVLEMRFMDHVLDDAVIDSLVVSVALPEGAEDVQVAFPNYPGIQRLPDSVVKTYLDTTGRLVVSASKSNLVENHIQNFQIRYRLPPWRLLIEPFLVVAAFYLLFLAIIIYVRLDFSISKDESSEARMKAGGIMEGIGSAQEKRERIYAGFDSAISALKTNKDSGQFQGTLKNLNADHKALTQLIADQMTKLKGLQGPGGDGGQLEKAAELQRLDRAIKDVLGQQVQLAERLVGGKIQRNNYITDEGQLAKKREDFMEKIRAITATL